MPNVWYRQPWFWAILVVVPAILGFTLMIAASGRNRDQSKTTVVQAPPAPPVRDSGDTTVVTTPAPAEPAPTVTPAPVVEQPAPRVIPPPVVSTRPAQPARSPAPTIVRERTVIREPQPESRETTRPALPADPPGSSRTTPGGAAKDFQQTGLMDRTRYGGNSWRAVTTVEVADPATELTSVGTSDNGDTVFVSVRATAPYTSILIAVPDEEGTFVEYRRR